MTPPGEALTRALTAGSGPGDRLQAVLSVTAELLSLQRCHLYVRDDDSGSYRLVNGWADPRAGGIPREERDESRKLDPLRSGGAAEMAGMTPGLELSAPGPPDLERVATPMGSLTALRLAVSGQLDAVLLLGGSNGRLSLLVRRRVERVRAPLSSIVTALLREAALERDLAAATSRVETGRRLRDSTMEPDRFLRLLLGLAVRATSSEGGFVAVSDPQGRLGLRVAEGLSHRPEALDVTPETGIFDWSFAGAGALLLRDPEEAARLGIRSLLAVPLIGPGGPLGVVALSTHSRPAAFTGHNLRLLGLVAEQLGLMVENERVFSEFSRRYLQVLQGISRTLDARRPETVGYHERTGRLAAALGRALGLDAAEVDAARTAGLMHDVGVAAVPVSDRAFLSDIEHPAVGADLVEGLPLHPGIAGAVATHHEWYDGWGFPGGLRGDGIPLLGRVLGLAAFCSEMVTGNAARAAWNPSQVLEEARRRAGSQFDPAVVEAGATALATELIAGDAVSEEGQ